MNQRLLAVVLLPLSVIGGWKVRGWTVESSAQHSEKFPSIEELQTLSSLVTARVEVADVMQSELSGFTGSEQIAILIKGDCLIGTDLSRAKFEKIDPIAHRAVLMLATPTVISARLDLNRTRVYLLTASVLWQITPATNASDLFLVNRGYADAQQMVSDAGRQPEAIQRAKSQAEVTLSGFFKALGWDTSIRWAEAVGQD